MIASLFLNVVELQGNSECLVFSFLKWKKTLGIRFCCPARLQMSLFYYTADTVRLGSTCSESAGLAAFL